MSVKTPDVETSAPGSKPAAPGYRPGGESNGATQAPAAPGHGPTAPGHGSSAGPQPLQAGAPSSAPAPRKRRNLRRILVPLVVVVLAIGGYVGYGMYEDSLLYVSTDNAQISGQQIQVGSLSAGRVSAIHVTVGATVHKGDTLAEVMVPVQVGVNQNGTPKLDFVPTQDSRTPVVSPIDGVVLALPSAVGDTVAAGTPIVTLMDPSQLWVNANIEETKIGRVRVGQPVDIHVDALDANVPGRVEAITPATAATFSLLPASNASGNFNKVTQLVPVRIAVVLGNQPALLGSSVEVKVHVAE